jgi:hypothetical protein
VVVLQEFLQQLSDIHPLVRDFAEWAVVGLVLTIALFLISIPAHVVAESMRAPVAAAAAYFSSLASASIGRAYALFRGAMDRPAVFASLARYRFVFDHHERTFRRDLKAIEQAARNFPDAVNLRTAALEAGTHRLTSQIELSLI